MTALGLSLLFNFGLLGLVGLCAQHLDFRIVTEVPKRAPEEAVATIYLEPSETESLEVVESEPVKKPFARTSEDQPASTQKTHERIGERSTLATSDRLPEADAPPLPSQHGVEPKEGEIETTESRYQDGAFDPLPLEPVPATPLEPVPAAPPIAPTDPVARAQQPVESLTPPSPTESAEPSQARAEPARPSPNEERIEERTPPPARETLLQGPDAVEVNVPREVGEGERPRETPPQPDNPPASARPQELVSPSPPETPARPQEEKGFQGNQRKTAMIGSISRTGRSALNVDETVEGRYQAVIGRAVELEWQRNCVRHRDFITPGFLTVRFYIEPSGRVRSVHFVGEMETGEVQKGFTLSSIRDAEIPPMPKELAESYEGDAMELVFRFFF